MPGYGFAKVPLKVKAQWKKHIEDYFAQRVSLKGLVLPIDIRHPLTPLDEQMLAYCVSRELPTLILLTKADKLTRNHANQAQFQFLKQLKAQHWDSLPYTVQLFSAVTQQGADQARALICEWLELTP